MTFAHSWTEPVGAGILHPHMPPRIDTPRRRETDKGAPAGGPGPSPARMIVIEFLKSRLEANNARLVFLLDPTPENMTAWVDAEEKLGNTVGE